mgnify:CR=1 FL=1
MFHWSILRRVSTIALCHRAGAGGFGQALCTIGVCRSAAEIYDTAACFNPHNMREHPSEWAAILQTSNLLVAAGVIGDQPPRPNAPISDTASTAQSEDGTSTAASKGSSVPNTASTPLPAESGSPKGDWSSPPPTHSAHLAAQEAAAIRRLQDILQPYDVAVGLPVSAVSPSLLRKAFPQAKFILVEESNVEKWSDDTLASAIAVKSVLRRMSDRSSVARGWLSYFDGCFPSVLTPVSARRYTEAPPGSTVAQPNRHGGSSSSFFSTVKTAFQSVKGARAGTGGIPLESAGPYDRVDTLADLFRFEDAVKRGIPPDDLLVFREGDGWEALCFFLVKPMPGATTSPEVNNVPNTASASPPASSLPTSHDGKTDGGRSIASAPQPQQHATLPAPFPALDDDGRVMHAIFLRLTKATEFVRYVFLTIVFIVALLTWPRLMREAPARATKVFNGINQQVIAAGTSAGLPVEEASRKLGGILSPASCPPRTE